MIDTTKVTMPEPIDVYRERCKQLEQLCLDMLAFYKTDPSIHEAIRQEDEILERMDELGLLEVDE